MSRPKSGKISASSTAEIKAKKEASPLCSPECLVEEDRASYSVLAAYQARDTSEKFEEHETVGPIWDSGYRIRHSVLVEDAETCTFGAGIVDTARNSDDDKDDEEIIKRNVPKQESLKEHRTGSWLRPFEDLVLSLIFSGGGEGNRQDVALVGFLANAIRCTDYVSCLGLRVMKEQQDIDKRGAQYDGGEENKNVRFVAVAPTYRFLGDVFACTPSDPFFRINPPGTAEHHHHHSIRFNTPERYMRQCERRTRPRSNFYRNARVPWEALTGHQNFQTHQLNKHNGGSVGHSSEGIAILAGLLELQPQAFLDAANPQGLKTMENLEQKFGPRQNLVVHHLLGYLSGLMFVEAKDTINLLQQLYPGIFGWDVVVSHTSSSHGLRTATCCDTTFFYHQMLNTVDLQRVTVFPKVIGLMDVTSKSGEEGRSQKVVTRSSRDGVTGSAWDRFLSEEESVERVTNDDANDEVAVASEIETVSWIEGGDSSGRYYLNPLTLSPKFFDIWVAAEWHRLRLSRLVDNRDEEQSSLTSSGCILPCTKAQMDGFKKSIPLFLRDENLEVLQRLCGPNFLNITTIEEQRNHRVRDDFARLLGGKGFTLKRNEDEY